MLQMGVNRHKWLRITVVRLAWTDGDRRLTHLEELPVINDLYKVRVTPQAPRCIENSRREPAHADGSAISKFI